MKLKLDWQIAVAYILAACVSSAVMFSISPDRLVQHILSLIFGFALVVYLSSYEPGIFSGLGWPAYYLTVFLLLMTLLLGENVRGSIRWINIGGFQFQASEFTKPLLILAFSQIFEKYPLNSFKNFCINSGLFALPALLIFRQPDLGTALVLVAIWLGQVLVSGAKPIFLSLLGAGIVLALVLAPHILHDYQLRRLTSFADPSKDPLGSGYNVIQSVIAVGSGGIFGKGLGHGTQSHLRFLPERHTDFVFASLAEELGLVGALFVIITLSTILERLLRGVFQSLHRVNRLILSGVFAYICFQTFVNIGMNIGIAPVTGITLPLISYGGSSVIALGMSLGISSSIITSDRDKTILEIK